MVRSRTSIELSLRTVTKAWRLSGCGNTPAVDGLSTLVMPSGIDLTMACVATSATTSDEALACGISANLPSGVNCTR